MILLAFFLGCLFWTLLEYLMHRFLGHEHKGRNFFKDEHQLHHRRANYFAPVYKKILLAVVVSAGLALLLNLFLPLLAVVLFISGMLGMYVLYEATHFRFHNADPTLPVFVILRKHHFYHHFHDPKVNHGVTTRFWDRVFGTFERVESVRVPKRFTMDWLLSEGELKSEYEGHFRIA